MKEHFFLAVDSLKPINLIKSTFRDVSLSKDLKGNILSTSVGLAAGLLVKIAIGSLTRNPARKLIGTVLMYGITKVAATHPDTVKSLVRGLLNRIGVKKNHNHCIPE